MGQSLQRLERDLGPLIDGDVSTDAVTRALYSTAACIYRVAPLGVVFPRSSSDVSTVLKYCLERNLPATARGAGSGVAGQSVGSGLIIDFARYMNRVIEVDTEKRWVRVEPGVVYASLNECLKPHGLLFAPDPSSGDICTIGGMLANNSGGSHSLMYGTTADYLLSARMFLSGGVELPAEKYDLGETSLAGKVRAVADILERNATLISRTKPEATKNASGYNVWDAMNGGTIDLARMVAGSEGTLGIFTEAKLGLVPLPASKATAMFCFADLEGMAESVKEIKKAGPSTIELMEKSLIGLLAGSDASYLLEGLPEGIEAILLVEFSGAELEEVEEKARRCLRGVEGLGFSRDFRIATDPIEQERLWEIRNKASSIFRMIHYPQKPLRFIEDAAVSVDNLPVYINRLRGVLESHGLEAAIFGHAGNGNVHVNPLVDMTRSDCREVVRGVVDEVVDIVSELKGTLSGEHGDGRLRTPYLPRMYNELCGVFLEIKHLFDPEEILNPGIITGARVEGDITRNIRYGYTAAVADRHLDRENIRREIDKCHGCGSCRVYCPSFTGIRREEATARAKANLLREYLIGEVVSSETMRSAAFKEVIDSCYNCRLCLTECPSRVDIPWLAVQARSALHSMEGFSLQDRFLMGAATFSSFGRRLSGLSNAFLRSPLFRRVMEVIVGVHRRRELPPFEKCGLSHTFSGGNAKSGGNPIVYFPGCYADYHSREGEYSGSLAVLRAMGYQPVVVRGKCCGVARLTIGDVDGFMKEAQELVEELDSYVSGGMKIAFSSPSCLMCVREEYPRYLESDRARQVASGAFDILELIDSEGVSFGNSRDGEEEVQLHIPCHLKSNGSSQAFLNVMERVPGVHPVGVSDRCCGLAGTFGMRKERFDLSMRIGGYLFEGLLNPDEYRVVTPCGACRMQIEQGTGTRVVHPVQLVAERCATGPAESKRGG